MAGLVLGAVTCASATDWPQYRGPNHDGSYPGSLTTNWTGSATTPVWRMTLGKGFSSFAVSQAKAITQVYRNSKETCIALSITNGAELWATALESGQNYLGYDGPRSTPSIDQDSVYVLTSNLKLLRLNLANGAIVWSNNLMTAFGAGIIGYAGAASPLLDGGLIYVNLNTGNQSLAAFWAANGAPAWRAEDELTTHSTPVAATILGVRQVIFATQNGLVSLHAANGQKLWDYPYPNGYNGVCLGGSPVVWSNIVFISQSYTPCSTAAQIGFAGGAWSATHLWDKPIGMIWMTPVCFQGAVYGPTGDNGSSTSPLVCLDLMTGGLLWSYDGFGRGSVTLAGDLILGLSEAGWLRLIRPDTRAYTELGSFQALDSGNCWNSIAIADGRVYARSTSSQAACFDLSPPNLPQPDLRLDPLAWAGPDKFRLTVRAADGTPVDSSRLAGIEVLASPSLVLPPSQWSRLTNSLVLTNGMACIDDLDAAGGQAEFFMVAEPK